MLEFLKRLSGKIPYATNVYSLSMVTVIIILARPVLADEHVYIHQIPQVNGVIFNTENTEQFYAATSAGLFSIASSGIAERVSEREDYLTEILRHPDRPGVFFSSGYRSRDEKLGVIRSDDSGKTWAKIADGVGSANGTRGPVAFYAMAISHSEPSILYGIEENIQVSHDGGLSWSVVGDVPGQVFDMAVSRVNPERVYIATRKGLYVSHNGGKIWQSAHSETRPTTMVNIADDGSIRAFIYNYGLVTSAQESSLAWVRSDFDFTGRAIMEIAVNPDNPSMIYGVADTGATFVSTNNGQSWTSMEGLRDAVSEQISAGRLLFKDNCQACHGIKGAGLNPDKLPAQNANDLPPAPALDDSAHAWHHPDDQLVETILDGSPRNKLMVAWKDHGLSRENAVSLVAYMKSLWNFSSLACQGARHMSCLR